MEITEEIRLKRSPDDPSKDVLVGLNGDIMVTDRIARAVEASGRLFPYVVEHIATNILSDANADSVDRNDTLRSVRDELLTSIQGLRQQRDLVREQQAENMTGQVDTQRPPYFAR